MNKLTKKQLLIGGLVLLFVINIAALGTIIYQNQKYNNHRNYQEESDRNWHDSHRDDRFDKNERRYDRHKHRDEMGDDETRSHPRRGNRFDNYIKDKLNFNDSQFEQFLELREKSKKEQHAIVKKLAQKREEMMKELSSADPDTLKLKQTAKQIGNLHESLKNKTIQHFIQVKAICNASQKEKFNELIRRMERQHDRGQGPKHHSGPRPQNKRDCRDQQ
jgi:Spy/CpxP family protein refolding chaperone